MRRYRRNPQLAARVIDEQAFVVTPADNKLHTLNETATTLWAMTAAGMTADDAAAALCAEYEVDLATARRDAEACLEDLVARQILIVDAT
ncbi:MAG: PqqD family protein [Kofleriaceae bacterium]|nr:PqqD family protein [Kofleriaceae bacterium]MCL4224134.1 PqqD family peptide modification chaperone [Myxococcales bacterium]